VEASHVYPVRKDKAAADVTSADMERFMAGNASHRLKFLNHVLPGEGCKFLREQCMLAEAKGFAGPIRSFDTIRQDGAREAGNLSCSAGVGLQSIDDFLHLFAEPDARGKAGAKQDHLQRRHQCLRKGGQWQLEKKRKLAAAVRKLGPVLSSNGMGPCLRVTECGGYQLGADPYLR
jgi:hypothetical protein